MHYPAVLQAVNTDKYNTYSPVRQVKNPNFTYFFGIRGYADSLLIQSCQSVPLRPIDSRKISVCYFAVILQFDIWRHSNLCIFISHITSLLKFLLSQFGKQQTPISTKIVHSHSGNSRHINYCSVTQFY